MKNSKWFLLAIAALLFIPVATNAEDAKKTWVDRILIGGDFRYRHEFISGERYSSSAQAKVRIFDRNRHRLRLRLSLQAQVNDQVDIYTRFATSQFSTNGGDPISTNADMGAGSSGKSFWLDRAYAEIRPVKMLATRVGKQPVPFETTELVFDGDLNLEGISALLNRKIGKQEVFLRMGGFWTAERGPDGNSKHALTQGLFDGQAGVKFRSNKLGGHLAVSYIDFGNLKSNPTVWTSNNGAGNSLVPITGRGTDTLGYRWDYNLIELNGSLKFKLDKIEPGLMFGFVTNSAAEKDEAYDKTLNTGWMAGLTAKFMKTPIDWDLTYNYRVLQKDAVVGAYAESDPAGGGTNYNGHKVSAGFTVMPSTRIVGSYLMNIKDPDNKDSNRKLDYDRLQIDLEIKI